MPNSITPTIGRKVWYWEAIKNSNKDPAQAFDATVIFVRERDVVDVVYTNHYGTTCTANAVPLQDYTDNVHGGGTAVVTWMPYQTQQQKKADAAS